MFVNMFLPAGYNNVEVAEFLLENGADVNAQDKGGLIPLHNASSYGVRTFSLWYIMMNMWNIKLLWGLILFGYAFCVFQHVDIAALLIKFNTCVNAVDRWGFTPLHEAAQKGRTQLCSLLVRYRFISCRFSRVVSKTGGGIPSPKMT